MARASRYRPKLEPGLIVQAEVVDPQGRNPKSRPLVLLMGDEAAPEGSLTAVAITGTLPKPLSEFHVLLPWHRAGHPMTGLKKRCAAVCNWVIAVQRTAQIQLMGRVPDKHFAKFVAAVRAFRDRESPPVS